MEGIIKMGPWGGPGGSKWSQCGDSAVRKIVIAHGWAIDSIQFLTSSGGKEQWSKLNGGKGGSAKDEIHIHYPHEYVTSIRGHIGKFAGYEVPRSLKICTNCEEYGPYGREKGTYLSIPIYGGVIVGFHGRAGGYNMDAGGIFVKPIGSVFSNNSDSKKCRAIPGAALASTSVEIAEQEVSRPLPIAWGGVGGKPWDDGAFSGIKNIYIHTDGRVIEGIHILYKSWGSSDEICCIHGSYYSFPVCGIEMDEKEHLVSISGYYGASEGTGEFEVIKSLTFFTNKAKYGPIGGLQVGKYFSTSYSSSISCEIVGFFGRSGCYLDAIGVHMRYY